MSAKTQAKTAVRKSASSTPPVILTAPAYDHKPIHALIIADFKAVAAEGAAGEKATQTLKALLTAIDYSAPGAVNAVLVDLQKTYGETFPAKLAIRKTLIANAKKVVCGGVKDKHVVQGRGVQVLRDAVAKSAGLNDLRSNVSEAKPEALKDARGSTKKPSAPLTTSKVNTQPSGHIGDLPKTAPDAFAASQRMLVALESYFVPSDAAILEQIEALIATLRDREIAARLPKAA
jgi:hypothetical protein